MKRTTKSLALLLATLMVLLCAACAASPATNGSTSNGDTSTNPEQIEINDDASDSSDSTAVEDDYLIGIMTTTVSQSEESYAAATRLYNADPDHIIIATFPDNATAEQETTISTALSLAANPKVKAIVFSQAVQGTAAAAQKIREIRPDILLIGTMYADDTVSVAENLDVGFNIDVPMFGTKLAEIAQDYGCETMVFYTFARHLAIQTHADRLVNMQNRCDELGITLVQGTTPDPMGDAGVTGCQQYVLEDVPRMVDKYGVNTGFSGSNPSQQEPMIKEVIETGSYYLLPSDPSPFLGFPAALGLEIPSDKSYDVDYVISAIKDKVNELGMSGHMGCWKVPVMTLFMEGGVAYAKAFCEGQTNGEKLNVDVLKNVLNECAGGQVDIYPVEFNGVTYDNCLYFWCEYEVY